MPPTIIVTASKMMGGSTAARHLRSSVTRDEALSLYRDILRTAKAFHWCDDRDGVPWREKLRTEARKEYENARHENDPLIVARLIVTGRECVMEIRRKFDEADRRCMERIRRESENRDGGGEGRG